MALFLLLNFIAGFGVAAVNTFFRVNPWNMPLIGAILLTGPITLFVIQLCYASAYRMAPSFLVAWFVGSATSAICGWLTSIIYFRESVRLIHVLAIALIFLGKYLLIKH